MTSSPLIGVPVVSKHDKVMTLKQVANYFKVSEITVHRLTQKGTLPGFKIGRQWRYRRYEIELFGQCQTAKSHPFRSAQNQHNQPAV